MEIAWTDYKKPGPNRPILCSASNWISSAEHKVSETHCPNPHLWRALAQSYEAGRWLAESPPEWRPAQIRKYQTSRRNIRGRRDFVLNFNNNASTDTLYTFHQPAGLHLQRSAVHPPDRMGKRIFPTLGGRSCPRQMGTLAGPRDVLAYHLPYEYCVCTCTASSEAADHFPLYLPV